MAVAAGWVHVGMWPVVGQDEARDWHRAYGVLGCVADEVELWVYGIIYV